ncbi:MAG: helix-turn-helix domain-containing protein [Bacteroidales bacterium]|jgi:transcriptional regulator with XRE-family HTH domain|nr:helix-turn-helix domain-containing protein [Bacteroidales bacterium]
MENVLQKIKDIRNIKGFSYEYMANELGISTSAYRKIESSETKLTVERLIQISEILQTPVHKILGVKSTNVFYQNYNHDNGTIIANQDIETYYHQENRETTQKLIQALEDEITHLHEEILFLREMAKK